ncbi:hypothetical protein AVEN_88626-1 [Araneus ventricosus]|uniref:Uncharacterized protein n=1 Tax=Araneus ventricosus TaxID=182803 RepID=A0A4Y2NEK3_ARAVE|nr:hypothetical protein AVEN_88626-1 [Araneus ventricosus]
MSNQRQRYPICYATNVLPSENPPIIYSGIPSKANPLERKNRDLKSHLAILVADQHDSWREKLPSIRFAMNTAKCSLTGQTSAFLTLA